MKYASYTNSFSASPSSIRPTCYCSNSGSCPTSFFRHEIHHFHSTLQQSVFYFCPLQTETPVPISTSLSTNQPKITRTPLTSFFHIFHLLGRSCDDADFILKSKAQNSLCFTSRSSYPEPRITYDPCKTEKQEPLSFNVQEKTLYL